MNRIPAFIIIILLLLPAALRGQYNRDSIAVALNQIRKGAADTAQVVKLRRLGHDLIEKDSALSKQILTEALTKSLSLKETNTITDCYRLMGIWYSYFEKYDEALKNYRFSFQSAKNNNNQFLMGGALYNMGNIKYWQGQYDSSIHFYISSLRIFENEDLLKEKDVTERKLDMRRSDIYNNLSMIFNTLKNLQKADEYIDKAIAITKKYNSPAAADALAQCMQAKADNYYENGHTEKALRTRLSFLPQMEKGQIARIYIQMTYQNIAQEYFALNQYDSSDLYAQKSLALSTALHAKAGIANANWQLGRIALQNKNYSSAEKHLALAADFYLNSEDHAEQRNYFEVMHQLRSAQGKYQEAYDYFGKFNAINDSLLISEKAKEFSEREIRYESEKKEAKLQMQDASIRQKNTFNYILLIGATALLIILLLSYRNYQNRRKLQQQRITELETQQQLTATEAVLKGEEQERTRLAKDLHDGLGGMLSGIKFSLNTMKGNLIMTPDNAQAFERSIDMLDSSIKEMRRVAHNMMPEALVKFGLDTALKDFCLHISQSGALQVSYQSMGIHDVKSDQTIAITIYRIVQELIHNTIKHAAAQHAIVQLSFTDPTLSITVEDDGKGFDTTALQEKRGIGWSNIRNRVSFLNGTIDIQSAHNKGTSVLIELPVG